MQQVRDEPAAQEVYGRKIGTRRRAGAPKHLYLPGPHRGVWTAAILKAQQGIILWESLIDAMTFFWAAPELIFQAPGDQVPGAISRDGALLIFIQLSPSNSDLWRINLDGSPDPLAVVAGNRTGTGHFSSLKLRVFGNWVVCFR